MRSAANARGKSSLSDCDSVANARAMYECGDCCDGPLLLLLLPLLDVSNESSLAKVTNMHGSGAHRSVHGSMGGSTNTPPKLSLSFESSS